MISDYLKEELINVGAEAKTPEEAITAAGELLLNAGKIESGYIDSMIDTLHNLGPYIVIAPGIAIPHGKPGGLVKEDCISFVKLKAPVKFNHPDNDPVKYVFAIGGNSTDHHIDLLRDLSIFLMNSKNLEALEKIENKEEFLILIKKGGNQ